MLRKDSFYDERFPAVSNAVKYYKESKGGQEEMCEAIEKLANSRIKQLEDAIEEKVRIEVISKFLGNGGSETDAQNMLDASLEEIDKAKELLLQPV